MSGGCPDREDRKTFLSGGKIASRQSISILMDDSEAEYAICSICTRRELRFENCVFSIDLLIRYHRDDRRQDSAVATQKDDVVVEFHRATAAGS